MTSPSFTAILSGSFSIVVAIVVIAVAIAVIAVAIVVIFPKVFIMAPAPLLVCSSINEVAKSLMFRTPTTCGLFKSCNSLAMRLFGKLE